MNEYDSAKMADVLAASDGLELTDNVEEADVILINTCSIREKAQEKVFSQLGRWKSLKQGDRPVVIGVGGCVASQEGEAIVKRAPYVDLVFGPQTLHRLPELIARQARAPACRRSTSASPRSRSSTACPSRAPKAPARSSRSWKAAASTARSAWCPTPAARRSAARSRTCWSKSPTSPRRACARSTCSGQNVNAYRGPYGDGEIADLGLLIRAIAEIEGIGRIRFTTSHPLEFSDSLIEAYRDVPKLANYLHLPVQAGSDRVLAAMKRGYTALEFKQKIRKLRAVRPDISISSDFIVGFPGETDADFEKTMKLIEDVGFDQSFSFIYSRRPGTPGRRPGRQRLRRGEARAPVAPAGGDQRERARDLARRWSAACSACWSRARRRRIRTNSPARPRTCAR